VLGAAAAAAGAKTATVKLLYSCVLQLLQPQPAEASTPCSL